MIITVDQIKTLLGLSDSTYDADLTALLPALDAKVKEITGKGWNLQIRGRIDGTANMEVRTIGTDPFLDAYPSNTHSIGVNWSVDDVADYITAGQSVTGDGIPDDTFINDVFIHRRTIGGKTYQAPLVELSQSATATGDIDIEVGFNRAYHRIVAKLAWWMLQDQSTDTPAGSVASKSLGDISVSYSTAGADLDGRYGVPMWAVRGLPRYARGH